MTELVEVILLPFLYHYTTTMPTTVTRPLANALAGIAGAMVCSGYFFESLYSSFTTIPTTAVMPAMPPTTAVMPAMPPTTAAFIKSL